MSPLVLKGYSSRKVLLISRSSSSFLTCTFLTAPHFLSKKWEQKSHSSLLPVLRLILQPQFVWILKHTLRNACLGFLHCCPLDYVGSKDNVDAMHAVTEVWNQISAISQHLEILKMGTGSYSRQINCMISI